MHKRTTGVSVRCRCQKSYTKVSEKRMWYLQTNIL